MKRLLGAAPPTHGFAASTPPPAPPLPAPPPPGADALLQAQALVSVLRVRAAVLRAAGGGRAAPWGEVEEEAEEAAAQSAAMREACARHAEEGSAHWLQRAERALAWVRSVGDGGAALRVEVLDAVWDRAVPARYVCLQRCFVRRGCGLDSEHVG